MPNLATKSGSPTPSETKQVIALFNIGRYPELESLSHSLTTQYPESGFAWKVLGAALQIQGKEALPALQQSAKLLPDDAEAHNNLGAALKDRGKLDEAMQSCRRALVLKPDYAEAHNNLGAVLKDLEQFDEAVLSCHRALALKPDYAQAYSNLGEALQSLGELDDAVTNFRQALAIKPEDAEANNNLGAALKALGQLDEAVVSYRGALSINPGFAEAHSNLAVALQALGQFDDAVASYRHAVAIKPDLSETHSNLAVALQLLGRFDDAVASFRRALEIKPDFVIGHSNLLFCLCHGEAMDAEALFAEHCRFGEQFEAPLRANWPRHANSRDPDRRLQIGFVSADLRNHPMASFIEPVLAHLSQVPQLSLHAYSNYAIEDEVSERLRGYLAHWHPIAGLSDEALAKKISDDGIDILIDLSGHTAGHRLLAFARKPAPVQASWIGYPTTGLRAVDYYLADRFLLPQEIFASQFTEKLVYLPAYAPFMPAPEAPPIHALPVLTNGYLTFGSFNRLNKISRSVIALWAQLLRATPNSIMLMGGMPEEGKYDRWIEWFAQEGISQDRLRFHKRSDMNSYLGQHHQVDLCLDTFPHNGGTTTLHALWMGVPTLTLVGTTPVGQAGAAILGHVGLEAFVAKSAEAFVHKGLFWANNLTALSAIRTGLRERFSASAMGQPALIAEGLHRALRMMWQRWCQGLRPAVIDVSDTQCPVERVEV